MAYVPATIEPQFVQMTGFHYDFSSGDIKYTLKFGATVSDLAKVKIQEAITGVDVLTPGWGDAAIGNVTGTAATGLFADPAFGTDARWILTDTVTIQFATRRRVPEDDIAEDRSHQTLTVR